MNKSAGPTPDPVHTVDLGGGYIPGEPFDETCQGQHPTEAWVEAVRREERKRIALELHDQLGQYLTVIKLEAAQLERGLSQPIDASVSGALKERVKAVMHFTDEAIQVVQRVALNLHARSIEQRPEEVIGAELSAFQRRTGVTCRSGHADVVLSPAQAECLIGVFREALTNIARHAEAGQVDVSLEEDRDRVVLTVKDDGRGIQPEQIASARALGIRGMQQRVRECGGELRITGRPGEGTTVTAWLPKMQSAATPSDGRPLSRRSPIQAPAVCRPRAPVGG
ncbi:sensor histidine kinase [Candidatus Nitrospira bockiana]